MMKQSRILYLCAKEEPSVVKVLSSRHSLSVYHVGTDSEWEEQSWSLVVFQDAEVWQKQFLRKLRKYPWLFISTRTDIRGYIAPASNLFGAINMGGGNLSLWGIPQEMQLNLFRPVERTADYYFFEEQPETCRIAYCPTGNSVCENDFKLISFIQTTNAVLTIVSDQYQALADAFPPSVEIVPQKSWLSVFRKAHMVVASGHDAIRAMALCKPCVVLGDCGLGGMVTPKNYEQLQSVSFAGRKGACTGEIVPSDLLECEIRKVFFADYKVMVQTIQKKVWDMYGMDHFSAMLCKEIEEIIDLSATMKSKKKRLALKPFRSSAFCLEELDGKQYMMRGMLCFGELDEDMSGLLEQCNGTTSILELIEQNGYDEETATILWENLCELWKKKLIVFKP